MKPKHVAAFAVFGFYKQMSWTVLH